MSPLVSIEEMNLRNGVADKIHSNDLVEILFLEKKQLIDEAVAVTAVATHLNSSWDWEGRSLVPNATRCQP